MGKIAQRPRRRDRHRRPARRASRCRGSTAGSSSTGSRSRTATSPVLHEIEIDVPPAGCIALVGESGGGKSTTARLIARFYDPDDGAVRVDGVDLRDVQLRSYRRQLGVVLQDPFLFSGTVADNIRFGRARTRPTRRCCRWRAAVGVDRVAARLDGGLDHLVREGGAGLSAGRAPADLDRARAARRPADPDPRRGDLEHRPADRDPDRARVRHAARAAGPRSSSRTGSPPSAAPTRSSSSSTAASSSAAPRPSCSRRTGRSAGSPTRCRAPVVPRVA